MPKSADPNDKMFLFTLSALAPAGDSEELADYLQSLCEDEAFENEVITVRPFKQGDD